MLEFFLSAIKEVWPMIFIFTIILVSIRLVYIICNKKKVLLYKEVTMLFFIIYLLLLYYIVTIQDNNYGTNNFVPLKEILRYPITSSLFYKNVIGNILLFVPFGIFVTYYVKNKTFIPTLVLSILISSSIEFVQNIIGRTLDIDDVILNTIGGLLGYMIYKITDKLSFKLPKFIKSKLFLDILSLTFILAIIYLFFKFEFWRFIIWII